MELQTQQRINADIAARQAIQAQSYWHNLLFYAKGVFDLFSANPAILAALGGEFDIKAGALKDELQQEALLAKQHQVLAQLEKQEQEEKKRLAKLTLAHADALASLIAQEKDQIRQLQIGDSPRRQAIAQYDAEIRKIDQTIDALKRQKEFTAAAAAEAENARVLAAQIRDAKLKQLDDAERAREAEA